VGNADQDSFGDLLPPGTLVGGYRIVELASHGGFAAIYRARRLGSDEDVAVKVLSQDLTQSPRLRRRFQHEARALLELVHPNIVRVRDTGELIDGRPYFVMDWLAGQDLRAFMRERGASSPRETLALFEAMGAGLDAAHRAGVIHRDLKAQNVMVIARDGGFDVKLVDFGVAKLLLPELLGVSQVVTASTILGTPYYMAPEQILGQPVDARTDIYALGLLLYELLSGELPFRGETRVEVEEQHLAAPPPRVSEVAGVPAAFDEVIACCLAKDPGERHASVTAFLEALRAAVDAAGERGHLRPDPRQGIAILVEARLDPALDDVPDDVFADVEAILELARERLRAAGLVLEAETPVSLLAIGSLPRQASEDRAERARIVAVAQALYAELEARPARTPSITLAMTVHVGADLTALGAWAPSETRAGLSITPAAR
jgi:eukaryotic-like serine/threonine-protein kinase